MVEFWSKIDQIYIQAAKTLLLAFMSFVMAKPIFTTNIIRLLVCKPKLSFQPLFFVSV